MVYNTGNEDSLQKLLDKSQISGKRQWILLLVIENKESKLLNNFQELLEQISQSQSNYNQSTIKLGRTRAVEKMFIRKLPRTSLDKFGNTGTISK